MKKATGYKGPHLAQDIAEEFKFLYFALHLYTKRKD